MSRFKIPRPGGLPPKNHVILYDNKTRIREVTCREGMLVQVSCCCQPRARPARAWPALPLAASPSASGWECLHVITGHVDQ